MKSAAVRKICDDLHSFWKTRIFALLLIAVFFILLIVSNVFKPKEVANLQIDPPGEKIPVGPIIAGMKMTQFFHYEGSLTKIAVLMATYARKNSGDFSFELKDETTGALLVSKQCRMEDVQDNSYHSFDFDKSLNFNKKHIYSFSLCGSAECSGSNAVTCWGSKIDGKDCLSVNGKKTERSLAFYGEMRKDFSLYYAACAFGILLLILLQDDFLLTAVKRPERVFLLLGSISCAVILFFSTPEAVEDFASHFLRSYQIGDGKLLEFPDRNSPLSPNFSERLQLLHKYEYGCIEKKIHFSDRQKRFDGGPYDFGHFSNLYSAMNYTPFAYIPQSLSAFFARMTNMSLADGIFLMAVVGAFAYLLCLYWVIKLLPCYKWQFLILALIPTVLMHGISISADSGIICFSFLFFAMLLKLYAKNEPYSWKDLLVLAVIPFIFAQCKFVYFPCLFLLFFLPKKNFVTGKRYFGFVISVFLISVLCAYALNRMNVGQLSATTVAEQTKERMIFVLSHPFEFLKMWWENLFLKNHVKCAIQTLGGRYFLNEGSGRYAVIPLFSSFWIFYLTILFSSFFLSKERRFFLIQRLTALIVLAGSTFLIYVVFFCAASFGGIQGRYFIPLFPVLCFVLGQERWGLSEKQSSYLKGGLVLWILFSQVLIAESLLKTFWL